MGMNSVTLMGYTTKQEVKLMEYTIKGENGKEDSKVSYAYVTLMVKRGYQQTVRDAQGNAMKDDSGKIKKEDVTDAFRLKFKGKQAEVIASNKSKDQSRRLWIRGVPTIFEQEETYVMQSTPDGKRKQVELSQIVNGQKVPLKHQVLGFTVEVEEFQFIDANPNKSETVVAAGDNEIIVGDLSQADNIDNNSAFDPYSQLNPEDELPF